MRVDHVVRNLSASLALICCLGPSAFAGGPISSAEVVAGSISSPSFSESWTFTGATGDRVLVGAVTTSGPVNTNVAIRAPGGALEVTTSADRVDHALGASGTYTIEITDVGLNDAGTYSLSFMNVTAGPHYFGADLDGGPVASAQIRSGQTSVTDFDAFTFSGVAGERVLIIALATSGVLSTTIRLYPPGGGAAVVATLADRVDHQLAAMGTYTIVIEDLGLNDSGTYSLSLMNVTAGPHTFGTDLDGGPIASAEIRSGQTIVTDIDAFTFSGSAGERVIIGALVTSGVLNTAIYLYPPGGGPAAVATSVDRADHQLAASGTYTIVIEDVGLSDSGTYSLSFLNVTAGPHTFGADLDGGPIASNGGIRSGQIAPVPDMDAYTFAGTIDDIAQIRAVATSGTLNTTIYLYPPGGDPAVVATSTDTVTRALGASGLYTIVIEDLGINDTGTYDLTLTKPGVTAVPAPTAPLDPVRVVMLPAHPCPFSASATLAFSLPAERAVQLKVFDVAGALVRTLVEGTLGAGIHRFTWDGRDAHDGRTGAGVYYTELRAGVEVLRGKLVQAQ